MGYVRNLALRVTIIHNLFEIDAIQNGDPTKHEIMENTTMQNSNDSSQNMTMKKNLDVDDELGHF